MNFALSHILVPVDFSSHSLLATQYAVALAERLGASVELFHVVEDPIVNGAWSSEIAIPNPVDVQKSLIQQGEHRLANWRESCASANVPVVTTVRAGLPVQAIIAYAKASSIDLIVMGTHGRTGFAHLFMGSVAERVVRHAPCPVVTLRDPKVTARVTEQLEPAEAAQPVAFASALGHLGSARE
jgi:universal stress protein A